MKQNNAQSRHARLHRAAVDRAVMRAIETGPDGIAASTQEIQAQYHAEPIPANLNHVGQRRLQQYLREMVQAGALECRWESLGRRGIRVIYWRPGTTPPPVAAHRPKVHRCPTELHNQAKRRAAFHDAVRRSIFPDTEGQRVSIPLRDAIRLARDGVPT